jgi:hypothetical protein
MKSIRFLCIVLTIIFFNKTECMTEALGQQAINILYYCNDRENIVDQPVFSALQTIYTQIYAHDVRKAKNVINAANRMLKETDDRYSSPALKIQLFYWLGAQASKRSKTLAISAPCE